MVEPPTFKSASLSIEIHREHTSRLQRLWEEVRAGGSLPPRRSYHSAVEVYENLVVYGGQDMTEGVLNDLWCLPVHTGHEDNLIWQNIQTTGQHPPPLCRHSAISNDGRIYIFGGTNLSEENNSIYILHWEARTWERIPPTGPELPPRIDSHSAVLYFNQADKPFMLVFGGFVHGERTNSLYKCNLTTMQWEIPHFSGTPPVGRSGHSAVVYNNAMYIFGGVEESTEALNDTWKLDLDTMIWRQVQPLGNVPSERSGHSCCLYQDVMVLFGGIKEVTRETNDMFSYNFSTNTWGQIQFETKIDDPISANDLEEYKKAKIARGSPTRDTPQINVQRVAEEQKGKKRRTLYDGPPSPAIGKVQGRIPHARDGHSATVVGNRMLIFGGDRHQMPFNDLYAYSIYEDTVKTPLASS